jgi:hypothetical protein
MFIGSGILLLVAGWTLFSGLHPQWRTKAKWKWGIPRSAFGSTAFVLGLVIMSTALVARKMLHLHGAFTGPVLWRFGAGPVGLFLGPGYDLVRSITKR